MPLTLDGGAARGWVVNKVCVVGPGIVGMPMAALLADAPLRIGRDAPAPVTVIQRDSPTSGWKVAAINEGRSPIGGVEPGLDDIVRRAVAAGRLRASHSYAAARDADVILVSVQTDKDGFGPDYGPLYEALDGLCGALVDKPSDNIPLVVFESTLAPSSMATVIRERFARHGLREGRDVLLGNSPNRVMPGRLVERVAASDKLVAGLHPATPGLIARLYRYIVTRGTLHETNSMTAEVVKTLENAYRDVRIAFATEVVRHCDAHDVDFYALRERVNGQLAQGDDASQDANAVPSGALLVPLLGVGGHCLPKDGILLWWRRLEDGGSPADSLILHAREINDESPAHCLARAEAAWGPLEGRRVALLGVAYRFNSEDTRNSPTLRLAQQLGARGALLALHDPYVYPRDQNLARRGLEGIFTRDLRAALKDAEVVFVCTAHRDYGPTPEALLQGGGAVRYLMDAGNLYRRADVPASVDYLGIGRGRQAPSEALVQEVLAQFGALEVGVANEVAGLADYLSERFAEGDFNRVRMDDVRRLAATCTTGCQIPAPGPVVAPPAAHFSSTLAALAARTPAR